MALQQAIKAGTSLTHKEMNALINDLFICTIPNSTPNGKPTYMSGADLAALLKNMQSSSLDQIEIDEFEIADNVIGLNAKYRISGGAAQSRSTSGESQPVRCERMGARRATTTMAMAPAPADAYHHVSGQCLMLK